MRRHLPRGFHRFLHGLDDIGITLGCADEITEFEGTRPSWLD